MSHRSPLPLLLLLAAACADPLATPPTPVGPQPDVQVSHEATSVAVVMRNLEYPRGMAIDRSGALWVTESGTAAINGPCVPAPRGGDLCYSGTGSLSRLYRGRQTRPITGLPSTYLTATNEATGPNDVAFQPNGTGFITIGLGADPAIRSQLGPNGPRLGRLLRLTPDGQVTDAADAAAFEGQQNPGGGPLDSNPYGVFAEAAGRYIADAGGNSLLLAQNGQVSLVATFAPIPVPGGPFNPPFTQSDAVPTEVIRGPDGALYVSTLTGVPFLPGAASIYRVVPGQAPSVYAGGLTAVTDFAFGDDGSLYVVQFASAPFLGGPGSVVRIYPNGTRTTVINTLSNPTAIAVGNRNTLYVANFGVQPGLGEVISIVQ